MSAADSNADSARLASPLASRVPVNLTPDATGVDGLALDGTAEAAGTGTLHLGLTCDLRNEGFDLSLVPARSSIVVELDAQAPSDLQGFYAGQALAYSVSRLDVHARWDVAFVAPAGHDNIALDATAVAAADLCQTTVSGQAAVSAELVDTLRAANAPPARIDALWMDLSQPCSVTALDGTAAGNAASPNAAADTRAAPDIVIESVTVPPTVGVGETLHVAWTGKNQGDAEVPGLEADGIWLSRDNVLDRAVDYNLGTQNSGFATYWNSVPADATYDLSLDITIPIPGTWYVFVEGDNWNDHVESDEGNNFSLPQAVEVTGTGSGPDLEVTIDSAPASVAVNQTFTVNWTVANSGDSPAAATWYDRLYLSSDATLDTTDRQLSSASASSHAPLAAGTSYSLTKDLKLPLGGTWCLLFVTDATHAQIESDETNNVVPWQIAVTGGTGPNLQVIDFTAPATANAGDSCTKGERSGSALNRSGSAMKLAHVATVIES